MPITENIGPCGCCDSDSSSDSSSSSVVSSSSDGCCQCDDGVTIGDLCDNLTLNICTLPVTLTQVSDCRWEGVWSCEELGDEPVVLTLEDGTNNMELTLYGTTSTPTVICSPFEAAGTHDMSACPALCGDMEDYTIA